MLHFCSFYPDGHVEVRLITLKTRAAPLTKPTIPRLELLGVLFSQLANTVLKSMSAQPLVTYILDGFHNCVILDQEREGVEPVC